MAIQLSTAARNALLDAIARQIDGGAGQIGRLRLYSGTPPASAGTALSGNTLLADCACSATFAPAAANGVLTANAIANDNNAANSGTASFFRLLKNDNTTVVAQGTVGISGSGADCIMNTNVIAANGIVSISSLTLTAPGA